MIFGPREDGAAKAMRYDPSIRLSIRIFGLVFGIGSLDAFDATNDFNGFQHCAATHLFSIAAGENKACAAGDLFAELEDFNAAVNQRVAEILGSSLHLSGGDVDELFL